MIQNTVKNTEYNNTLSLVVDFNAQHKQIERIVRKYWNIIKANRHLGVILPEKPRFTYWRAPTLRDRLARNVLDPPTRKNLSFFEGKGYYPCKKCYTCRHTKESKKKKSSFISTVTTKEYPIEDFISCQTEGVVYLLECPCRIQYIGRTKSELKILKRAS